MTAFIKSATGLFFEFLAAELHTKVSSFVPLVKRTALGVMFIVVSGAFWFSGVLLLLLSLFFYFAGADRFALPAVWTALVSIGVASVVTFSGGKLIKGPRA